MSISSIFANIDSVPLEEPSKTNPVEPTPTETLFPIRLTNPTDCVPTPARVVLKLFFINLTSKSSLKGSSGVSLSETLSKASLNASMSARSSFVL